MAPLRRRSLKSVSQARNMHLSSAEPKRQPWARAHGRNYFPERARQTGEVQAFSPVLFVGSEEIGGSNCPNNTEVASSLRSWYPSPPLSCLSHPQALLKRRDNHSCHTALRDRPCCRRRPKSDR